MQIVTWTTIKATNNDVPSTELEDTDAIRWKKYGGGLSPNNS